MAMITRVLSLLHLHLDRRRSVAPIGWMPSGMRCIMFDEFVRDGDGLYPPRYLVEMVPRSVGTRGTQAHCESHYSAL